MTVRINKPAINLREELASLRNQGGLPKEDKLYLDDLVTNGDFSNGLTGWTSQVSGFVYSNGEVVGTSANGLYPQIRQTLKTETGRTYKLNIGKVQLNSGFWIRVRLAHGGVTDTVIQNNSSGADQNMSGDEGTAFFTAKESEVILILEVRDGAVGTFDNISVQEVGENLVTNGTFDYDSGWTKGTGWTISGGTASSDGSQTSAYSELSQVLGVSVAVGDTFTVTYTVSNYGAGTMTSIFGNDAGTARTGNGTFTDVYTGVITTSTNFKMRANTNFIGNVDNIIITKGLHPVIQSIPYGYDVKDVYIDGDLAREGEAYDYEVQTDGINQWLKPTVEPTATTETVVIGVRK